MYRVGVIGAGVAAASLLAQFATQASHLVDEIRIFDPSNVLAGSGFDVESSSLIANTSVGMNSLNPRNQNGFMDWLHDHDRMSRTLAQNRRDLADFVPRNLFLKYARQTWSTATDELRRQGVAVHHIRATVNSVRGRGRVCDVVCDDAIRWSCDVLVVCTGTTGNDPLPPAVPRPPWYVEAVSPDRELRGAAGQATHAVILGTRQSAVDAAITIAAESPGCRITLLSPSGVLPSVKTDAQLYPAEHFTAAKVWSVYRSCGSLSDSVRLQLGRELASSYESNLERVYPTVSPLGDLPTPHDLLREEIEEAGAGVNMWQYVVVNLLEEMNTLWKRLQPTEKASFRIRDHPMLQRRIGAVPLENATKLLALLESRQLVVRRFSDRPRMTTNTTAGGTSGVPWWCRGTLSGDGITDDFDLLVNATGANPTLSAASVLAESIGHAVSAPLVRPEGLNIDPETYQVVAGRADGPQIHIIGTATKGYVFLSNYIMACVNQARSVVDALSAELVGSPGAR